MELDYNILWFDDEEEQVVAPFEKRISKHLDDLAGFKLKIQIEENGNNLRSLLSENEFDLILVDWNLDSDDSEGDEPEEGVGAQIIQEIRNNGVYTPIIFYSGENSFRDTEYELEGIYFSDRDDDNLFLKIKEIIENTLQRNLRVSVTRGLFIASTIYLVEELEKIILDILKIDSNSLKFFKDYIVQAEFFNDASKYKIIKDYLGLWIKRLKSDIEQATDPEKSELEQKLKDVTNAKKKFNSFMADILLLRNYLAHAKPVCGEKNTLKVWIKEEDCHKNLTLDLDACKEIRKKFHNYKKNIDEIAALIAD